MFSRRKFFTHPSIKFDNSTRSKNKSILHVEISSHSNDARNPSKRVRRTKHPLFIYFQQLFKAIDSPCSLELLIFFLQNQRETARNTFHESIIDIKGNLAGRGNRRRGANKRGQRARREIKKVARGGEGEGRYKRRRQTSGNSR